MQEKSLHIKYRPKNFNEIFESVSPFCTVYVFVFEVEFDFVCVVEIELEVWTPFGVGGISCWGDVLDIANSVSKREESSKAISFGAVFVPLVFP